MTITEPTVGDALEGAARALEAVADVLRRLADREEFEQVASRIPAGDRNLSTAGQELGLCAPTVKRLIVTGQLKGYKVGERTWRVPAAEIERYKQRRIKQTAAGATGA